MQTIASLLVAVPLLALAVATADLLTDPVEALGRWRRQVCPLA